MRGSTHSLHKEQIDGSKNRYNPQESALFNFYLKLIIILWSGVRIPSPLPKFKPGLPGFNFGIVAKFIDVFYFVSIHNKKERSVLCKKYVKVVRCL